MCLRKEGCLGQLALFGGSPVRQREFPSWPFFDRSEEDLLLGVLRSGVWGGYSPSVREFERTFAARLRAQHCIALANGTASLEVALKCEGIGPGDEVVVPPFTFMATASAVLQCGAVPVFADIDPATLNLDPVRLEQAITPKTRAVIPVHFAGHAADMEGILAAARSRNLIVIEDAAHAHGSEFRGTPVGTLGEWGSFSFQASKVMTAGEGGCLVTRQRDRADRARSYCNQGRIEGGAWYDHYTLGTNLRITGFQAAVLQAQLARLDQQIATRQVNAGLLRQGLSGFDAIDPLIPEPYCTQHSEAFFLFRFHPARAGVTKGSFESALKAEGIPVMQIYPRPLYRNPVFDNSPFVDCGCPEAEKACAEIVALPINVLMGSPDDMADVITAVTKTIQSLDALRAAQHIDSEQELPKVR